MAGLDVIDSDLLKLIEKLGSRTNICLEKLANCELYEGTVQRNCS